MNKLRMKRLPSVLQKTIQTQHLTAYDISIRRLNCIQECDK